MKCSYPRGLVWLTLAASCLLSACAPTYFLTMQPTQPNGPWVNGHPTSQVQHEDSVEVRLGFVRYELNELVFEAQVSNYSGAAVLVAPELFYYVPLLDTTTARPDLSAAVRTAAIDPEVRLRHVAQQLHTEAKQATKVSFFEVLSTVADVAESVSSIKKKETEAEIAERDERHASNAAFFDQQRAEHASTADQLLAQQEHLEQALLRKQTLAPGQQIRGQVRFPRHDEAHRFRVVAFFDERPVQFDFRQLTHRRQP